MEIKQYIQTCVDQNDVKELSISWYFAGQSVCNSDTRFYKAGDVYVVKDALSAFNNQLLYCDNNYIGQIDWSTIDSLDEAQQVSLKSGLVCPCFTFYNTQLDITNTTTYVNSVDASYQPFTKYADLSSNLTDIIIDDDQYYQIMQVVGQPFIKDRELEYNRQAILKLAVEPALREYYTTFPLEQEEVRPQFAGGDFLIPYPTAPYPAYKAIAWVTSPGGLGSRGGTLNMSPLAALGTDVSLYNRYATGGSGKFATGLQYNKPVPGYTGRDSLGDGTSAFSQLATAWPIANTMKNLSRREKLSKVHIPGKGLFARGYSTMTGCLNILWYCWSRDFSDVEFEDWQEVVPLCQAHVKMSIGAIRDLLGTDSNIKFKEGMQKEGQQERDAILKAWSESPVRLRHVTSRGGLV